MGLLPFARTAVVLAIAGSVALGPVASAQAATGLAPAAPGRPPVPVVSVAGLPSPRLDQDTTSTVVARGASRLAPVVVSWGDGSTSRGRTRCSAATASRRPAACVVRVAHAYDAIGAFPIVVRSGARVVARSSVTVRDRLQPWTPPTGWVQPAGWAFYPHGATYAPCSTVPWRYDRTGEPASAVGMHAEVVAGLALLAAQTGLGFAETDDPTAPLAFGWEDLAPTYGDAAGIGGRRGPRGFVTFSTTHWWPTDAWPGFGIVTQPDGSYAVGRGWLVVHETMHALGMDHVDDVTAVMNPYAGATAFNTGDLDGLHTLYPSNPCPA